MNTSPIISGEPFSEEKTRAIVQQLHRDGFAHIPGVLTSVEANALRAKTDELFADPVLFDRTNPDLADPRYIQLGKHEESGEELPFILRNTIELDPIFRDMLLREPILGIAEAVVGKAPKFCGQNVLRNLPGVAIERWHVDGQVHFPLPENVSRHDPRIRMPVMWFTVQMALTDITSIEQGPTQYVPGSHYSGRDPNNQDHPKFEESRSSVGLLQSRRHLPARPPMLAPRGAQSIQQHPLYYSITVRRQLGILAF